MNINLLKKSLGAFLEKEIQLYKKLNSNELFFKNYKEKIHQSFLSGDELLKLFYFNRFFSVIFHSELKNKLITEIPINTDSSYISNIEDIYIKKIFENKQIKNFDIGFFKFYGSFRKSFLKKLHDSYVGDFDLIKDYEVHFKLMKLFMFQNYEGDWHKKCFKFIKDINNKPDITQIEFYLLFHFSNIENKLESNFSFSLDNISKVEDQDFNTAISKTQNNLKKILEALRIEYIEEFNQDGFSYDFYLPKFNIALEFDGPLHFYPLQTQYIDYDKFRYRMINDLFKRRIVYIPYFEWMKLENDKFCKEYLRNLIFLNWDYKNTNCFRENYNMGKVNRIFV